VPDDRVEVVEAELAALHANVGVERDDGVASDVLAARG
jgi:hypothetical protein